MLCFRLVLSYVWSTSSRTTFTIDVAAVRRAITSRTRLVISRGRLRTAGELPGARRTSAIPTVSMSSQMLRVRSAQRSAINALGSSVVPACLSFHPRKIVTTGEGGMVLTDDAALASRLRRLRNHGSMPLDSRLCFAEMGFNYRMSDILAAVGIEQLHRLDEILAARRDRAAALMTLLESCPGVTPQVSPPGYLTSWQSFVVVLDERIDRGEVVNSFPRPGLRPRSEPTLST